MVGGWAKKSLGTLQRDRDSHQEQALKAPALRNLHVRITNAKHIVKIQLLTLAALHLSRLYEITIRTHRMDHTLAVEALLEAAERTFDGLAFTDFYFD